MLTAFTFPGQGSQFPGMLRENLPDDPTTHSYLSHAESALGQTITSIDSERALKETVNVQLALLISGVIWGKYLMNKGCIPDYVMGLSVGAYPAAVLAGCLSFEDALQLVSLRGRLMQTAFPQDYGMLALLNVNRTVVESVLEQQVIEGKRVYLANINAEDQFVLAGYKPALLETAAVIKSKTRCTSRLLEVAVPSHCSLLKDQSEYLLSKLEKTIINRPKIRYISASKSRLINNIDDIRIDLSHNMANQVHWHDSSQLLLERGVGRVIEIPPGSTLTGLCRRVFTQGQCFAAQSTRLDTLLYQHL
ncbi:ACP S-malonyltransferase [Neptunomonas phycophila]|uniref:ACP S-malonyltransferase n=1 Tax=Neptunomonas phycophila TaxID=1572645 RepID=UPI003735DBCE